VAFVPNANIISSSLRSSPPLTSTGTSGSFSVIALHKEDAMPVEVVAWEYRWKFASAGYTGVNNPVANAEMRFE